MSFGISRGGEKGRKESKLDLPQPPIDLGQPGLRVDMNQSRRNLIVRVFTHNQIQLGGADVRRLIQLVLTVVLLASCVTVEEPDDYSDRALVFAWIHVGENEADRLISASIRKFEPSSGESFNLYQAKFGDGYILWNFGIPAQAHYEFEGFQVLPCPIVVLMCYDEILTYYFSVVGEADGQTAVPRPGVYNMGSFALDPSERPGIFELSSEFKMQRVAGPSKASMLEFLLSKVPKGHPELAARIRAAMG